MKRFYVLLPVIAMAVLTSCSKDDISNITVNEAQAFVPGDWKVTYYFDNSNGVSCEFDGYTFTFGDDGTVTATISGTEYAGLWTVSSSDDDPNFDKEIEITISGTSAMDDLDGKWLITEISETVMKFKDDTPSEEIHFEHI